MPNLKSHGALLLAALLLPAFTLAQTAPASPKPAAKPAPKPAPKAKPSQSRVEIKSQASQMAAGRIPCEMGAAVTLDNDAKSPGYFNLQIRNLKYRMTPVATTTGAIRLEDQKAGAVWLQLANKSMLMNQKLGQRLADECMSPSQHAVAEAMKTAPPPSVLDKPAESAAAPSSAASAPQ
jgi:hypothetical protein